MSSITLHEVPFELVPSEIHLFVEVTPAGFPSPAQDDMEEPIDLASWLIDHPAASYVMRVAGHSMTGRASPTATWWWSAGQSRRGPATSWWRSWMATAP